METQCFANERNYETRRLNLVSAIVIIAYASLFIELLVFPVPSSASSYSLWKGSADFAIEGYSPMQKVKQWSLIKKTFVLGLPIVLIAITFIIPILIVLGIAPSYFLEKVSTNTPLIIVSIVLIIIGRLVTFSSALAIRKDNTQEGDAFVLHKDSNFSFSRNPIQVGMYIFSLGLLLLYPSWIFGLGCLIYIGYMDYKIKMEEEFLHAKFGAAYADYFNQTRRYL